MDDDFDINEFYSQPILIKAHRLVKADKVEVDSERVGVFHVAGSRRYSLQVIPPADGDVIPWVTCDCPNGLARGGRPSCYHSAAVLLFLGAQAEEIFDETPSFSDLLEEVRKRIE